MNTSMEEDEWNDAHGEIYKIIREYLLESHFHSTEAMAAALKLSVEEMDRMDPFDLATLIFRYCAINKLPLDEVFKRMENS